MRISDWSSDVCSSDLHRDFLFRHRRLLGAHAGDLLAGEVQLDGVDAVLDELAHGAADLLGSRHDEAEVEAFVGDVRRCGVAEAADRGRSEEHTSELQSLMSISYAVIWLKKKTTQ